jgi:hypothetical protein
MTPRNEALKLAPPAWTLSLTTTKDPDHQLKSLMEVLGRSDDSKPLQAAVEVCSPGWVPEAVPPVPKVFENTTYTLTLTPGPGSRIVSVRHPIRQEVGDSLELVGAEPGWWHGTLNTGNDLGWFLLEIGVCQLGSVGPVRTDRVAWLSSDI